MPTPWRAVQAARGIENPVANAVAVRPKADPAYSLIPGKHIQPGEGQAIHGSGRGQAQDADPSKSKWGPGPLGGQSHPGSQGTRLPHNIFPVGGGPVPRRSRVDKDEGTDPTPRADPSSTLSSGSSGLGLSPVC